MYTSQTSIPARNHLTKRILQNKLSTEIDKAFSSQTYFGKKRIYKYLLGPVEGSFSVQRNLFLDPKKQHFKRQTRWLAVL